MTKQKKFYLIGYGIIALCLIILHISHGIPYGVTLFETDSRMYPDGTYQKAILLIYNLLIYLAAIIAALVLTVKKNNTVKMKWFLPVIVIIYTIFLPIVRYNQIGGIASQDICLHVSLAKFILH